MDRRARPADRGRMRVFSSAVLIFLLCGSAEGFETETDRFVLVAEPLLRVAASPAALAAWCGGERVEACTHFVAYRLNATCAPSPGGFAMRAAATFRPWIFLAGPEHLAHERDHIEDLRRSVASYAAALEALTFADAPPCQARAVQETAAFEEVMRLLARQSNEERHGKPRP